MAITDQELRERLIALGYNPPPITGTSRSILLKKLKSLETGSKMETFTNSDSESFENENQNELKSNVNMKPDSEDRQEKKIKTKFTPIINKRSKEKGRMGILGTGMFLIGATVAVFFIFQFIGDWSDRRYRNVFSNDAVYPICNHDEIKETCIPESEAKFTDTNVNIVRASLHQIIISDHCKRKERKRTPEFMGMYPVLKDSQLQTILVEQLEFSEEEAKLLTRNSKVIFESNPKYDVKVLGNGFIYKNYRLLRSCGYMPWGDYIYTYSLYAIASFTAVWLTYRLNLWVSKLHNNDTQEIDLSVKDIVNVLKQARHHECEHVTVEQMREWLITSEDQVRRPKIWEQVISYVEKHQPGIMIKNKNIDGYECEVFSLI